MYVFARFTSNNEFDIWLMSFYCLTLFDQGKFLITINVKVNGNVILPPERCSSTD